MFRENLAIHVGPEYYRGELRHESQHVDHFNDNPLSIITGWWVSNNWIIFHNMWDNPSH